ncbi:dihydropteroate synthase [Halosegnis sp.]|uniref:dihydropteroate synthase n=1 Tax=Halosegnis sp. TaxID=2864959 RepID=UPI0035D4FD78
MQYHEAADRLLSLQQRRPKLGIETTERMLAHLGNPHEQLACVQVAGSNGKGSTAQLLERALREAGLDIGTFTSPGLNGFREQVCVNGRPMSKAAVVERVDALAPCLDRLRADDDEPTHFEALTAVALAQFAEADVDVAILEVGIGGRYDATSAVDPVASAVTSVSLEHTDLLGDTVAEIARDKAQVAPSDQPLVTAATGEALAAIREVTDVVTIGGEEADVRAIEHGMASDVESEVSITGPDWALETRLGLLGQHQATNAGVAAMLARQVADIAPSTLATGLRKAHQPGRFETVDTDPRVVLDGAHNPAAVETVRRLLDRCTYENLYVVFGAMADKEYGRMVEQLPAAEAAFVTRPSVDRAEEVIRLADAFDGRAARVQKVSCVPEATERALAAADESDLVLVTGSLYVVAEARERWTRTVVPVSGDGSKVAASLAGATYEADAADAVDPRVLRVRLRRGQATVVAEQATAVGVECRQSTIGTPPKHVETVLAGSRRDLHALASALDTDDRGLRRLATQIETALSPPDRAGPLPVDSTAVMGILNVTPDSFHDGGEYDNREAAVARAKELVAEGADIVDVGGESTRPGADPVPIEEEIDRVRPVVEALTSLDVQISVDTRKAAVARAALEAGADIINDVSGLEDPEMPFVVAEYDATLVLMHSIDTPVDPSNDPEYDDPVDDIRENLSERLLAAERAGLDRSQIIVDPGIGFGKTARESFELLGRVGEFRALGCPVLVGHSRKSMFANIAETSDERLPPTLAATALAAEQGADVVRVHDVAENAAAVRTVEATAFDSQNG